MDFVIDGASKLTEEGGKFREFGEVIWKLCGLDNLKPFEPPDKQRPFLSPIVWALFSAYRQVLTLPVVQVAALKTGGGRKILADTKPMRDLVKSALPHFADFIDQHGTDGLPYIVDDLEERLFDEIVASLNGATSDDDSIKQAAEILKAADKVSASVEPQIDIPEIPGLRAAD